MSLQIDYSGKKPANHSLLFSLLSLCLIVTMLPAVSEERIIKRRILAKFGIFKGPSNSGDNKKNSSQQKQNDSQMLMTPQSNQKNPSPSLSNVIVMQSGLGSANQRIGITKAQLNPGEKKIVYKKFQEDSQKELEQKILGTGQHRKTEDIYLDQAPSAIDFVNVPQNKNQIEQSKISEIGIPKIITLGNQIKESVNSQKNPGLQGPVNVPPHPKVSVMMAGLIKHIKMKNQEELAKVNLIVNTINLESDKKKESVSLVLSNYFSKVQLDSRKKRNCIFFQEMMKAMPSQEKKWRRKVKDFFTFKSTVNLKSYRTLAVEMLSNAEMSQSESIRIKELIAKYRISKTIYNQEYMAGWKSNNGVELDSVKEMKKLSEKNKVTLIAQEKQLGQFGESLAQILGRLKVLSEQLRDGPFLEWQTTKLEYKKMATEIRDATDDINFSKFEQYFSQSSTVNQFIREFSETHDQLTKWKKIKSAITEHFIVKNSKEYSDLYAVVSDPSEYKLVVKKTEDFVNYLISKANTKKTNLLLHFETFIKVQQANINNDVTYKEYAGLVVEGGTLKTQIKQLEGERDKVRIVLEGLRFKLQKSDFQDNFDYVFPSGLIIGLQVKKKELENMINGLNNDPSYLDTGDSDCFLPIEEQNQFTQFFKTEYVDLVKTLDSLSVQLKMALEIDEIEGEMDVLLGELIATAHTVEPEKNCFSLPQISYFLFTMFKTNVIIKESKFYEGFFSQLPANMVKEYIVFNYMLFTNESYVDDLLERYHSNYESSEPISKDTVLQEVFIKDYVTNYSLMIAFYRDMTEFGRAESGVVEKSGMFSKNFLGMILTMMQGKLGELMEEHIEEIINVVILAIIIAVPFIALIPFGTKILSAVLTFVLSNLIKMLTVFMKGVAGYFNRIHSQNLNKKLKEQLKTDFLFDYDKEIEKVRQIGVKKEQASFDSRADIKVIEGKYLEILNDDSNVFNKLENLHIFRDKDYDTTLIDVLRNKL